MTGGRGVKVKQTKMQFMMKNNKNTDTTEGVVGDFKNFSLSSHAMCTVGQTVGADEQTQSEKLGDEK